MDDYSQYFDSPRHDFEKSLINFDETVTIPTIDSPGNAPRDVFATSFLADKPIEDSDVDAENILININESIHIARETKSCGGLEDIFSASLIANWQSSNDNDRLHACNGDCTNRTISIENHFSN